MNLQERYTGKEQLDNLDLKGDALHQTLSGLQQINKWFGNVKTVQKALWKVIQKRNLKMVTIIDLGSGGGDLLIVLASFLTQKGIEYNMLGIEGNPNSVEYAQQKALNLLPNLQFKTVDILASNFQLPKCDILISSHFMYHFKDVELVQFLKQQQSSVRHCILISELQRSRIAYQLFRWFVPLLGFHPMIVQDGSTAIRRAFKRQELQHIFKEANISSYSIEWKWAFRFLILIEC